MYEFSKLLSFVHFIFLKILLISIMISSILIGGLNNKIMGKKMYCKY